MKTQYQIIVIGAGSGGLTAAISLAGAGKQVLLIEQDKAGGECTHSGCVPSKALLHESRNARIATASGHTLPADITTTALTNTRERIAHIYAEETPEILESHGIDFVTGTASFTGPRTVAVGKKKYSGDTIIISTGSSPRMTSIDGLSPQDILTNQNIFEQTSLPKRLLVIGAGPIGMEMAQAAAQLGCTVSIVNNKSRFAALEDADISPIIQQEFTDLGITIYNSSEVTSVDGNTATVVTGGNDSHTHTVVFDKVLMAIGRVPNLPSGLEHAGIAHTKYGITVNRNYQTTNRRHYAIGDVSQTLKFTHTANDIGRSVVKRILSKGWLSVNNKKAVPKVTYTQPEIAQVGLSFQQAVAKYSAAEVVRISVPYTTNDRAKTDHADHNGLCIVVAKRLSGKILGANIIGQSAGEILSTYTLAIDNKISLWKFSNSIFPYPTISQIMKKTGDEFVLQTLSSWKTDMLYVIKKHAPKIVALIVWIAIFYGFKQATAGMSWRDSFSMLHGFITGTVWGPLLYMIIYILRPIIFFPATILTALSGFLFGLPLGILYTMVGENGSANLAYWIGRFFGKDARLEDSAVFGPWVNRIRQEPFISVLIMRFIFVPFDVTNYGSGILKIKWSSYALATLIGIIPGLTTFVALGAALESSDNFDLSMVHLNPQTLVFSALLFVGSLLLARWLKKRSAVQSA